MTDDDVWEPYPLTEPPVALAVDRRDTVARVTLLGPGKGNAMGPDFWRELPLVFTALDADDGVRAVVVAGSGPHFTYGLDLAAFMASAGDEITADGGLAAARTKFYGRVQYMQAAINAVEACRKPVVAAVQGWCIGGGVDLISACDVRYAAADAKFSVRETRIAIVADVGSLQRLPGIIGEGHLRELALTGKDIDAARAASIGLVNEVLPDRAAALTAAYEFARQAAANAPLVVQGVKQVLDHNREARIRDGLKFVAVWNSAFMHSHDLGEAMTAFIEKRPPEFRGR